MDDTESKAYRLTSRSNEEYVRRDWANETIIKDSSEED